MLNKKLINLFCLLTLLGCQSISSHGNYIDDLELKTIKESAIKKSQLFEVLGTPTIEPFDQENVCFYVERSLINKAWFKPKTIKQRILKIKFDNHGVVEDISLKDDSYKDISILKEYTKTYGTELSFTQKFFRNIGRFNKYTDSKK